MTRVARTVGEFAANIAGYGEAIERAKGPAVRAGAQTAKNVYLAQTAAAIGGDRKMRNFRPTAGVSYELRGGDNPSARVRPTPPGMGTILESGTEPHVIGLGRSRMRTAASMRRAWAKAAGKYIAFADDQVRRAPVAHPGMSGWRVWTRTTETAARVVPEAMRRIVVRELTRGR